MSSSDKNYPVNEETSFNRSFLMLSLLCMLMLVASLYFAFFTLRKQMAFTRIKVLFISGQKIQKKKKIEAAARSLWQQGEKIYLNISQNPGYYTLIYKGYHQAGNCLRALGKNREAINADNLSLHYHPFFIDALFTRAGAAHNLGDIDLEIKSLELIEQFYPYNWQVAYNLADAYRRLGKLTAALPYYDKAWRRNRRKTILLLIAIKAYVMAGKPEKAYQLIEETKNLKMNKQNRMKITKYKKIIAKILASQGPHH